MVLNKEDNNFNKHVKERINNLPDIPPSPMELRLFKKIKRILKWKPIVGPTGNTSPRIVIFGPYGSGKSSIINSWSWVITYEEKGEFIMHVPSSRMKGVYGGANTNRLRLTRIGNMELIDTKGFTAGARNVDEIHRVCSGKRKFNTDMSWDDEQSKTSKIMTTPVKKMDFAILVVSALNPDYDAFRRVIKAIKEATECIPVIVVTNKDQIQVEGQEAEIHQQLTGMGASSAFFVTNYLIDGKGKFPTENDLDIQKHIDLCDALLYVQHEYDQHLEALNQSKTSFLAKMNTVGKLLLMLFSIIALIVLIFWFLWYNDGEFWKKIVVITQRTNKAEDVPFTETRSEL